jgi:hypothetical protein
LEAQQHKKYAQTTPLDDGVSSLFIYCIYIKNKMEIINRIIIKGKVLRKEIIF